MVHGLQWTGHRGILLVTVATTPSDCDVIPRGTDALQSFTLLYLVLVMILFTFRGSCGLFISFNDIVFWKVPCLNQGDAVFPVLFASKFTAGDCPVSQILLFVTEMIPHTSSLPFNLFEICSEESVEDCLFKPVSVVRTQWIKDATTYSDSLEICSLHLLHVESNKFIQRKHSITFQVGFMTGCRHEIPRQASDTTPVPSNATSVYIQKTTVHMYL